MWLFYRSIYILVSISNEILYFVETKIKDAAPTSFCNYNASLPRHLSNEKFKALQKSNKVNSVVILDKDFYIKRIESLLSNKAQFEKVDTKKGLLNFIANHEK